MKEATASPKDAALNLALEALEAADWYIDQLEMIVYCVDDEGTHENRAKVQAAITAIKEALAPTSTQCEVQSEQPSFNEWTNAKLASHYFDLLKVVERYEKHGVTCQTFRHFVTEPCAECNCVAPITAIKEALAPTSTQCEVQDELCSSQEPVAHMYADDYERMLNSETFCTVYSVAVGSPTRGETTIELFTTPPQRKPLTEDQIQKIWDVAAGAIPGWSRHIAFARAIEAKLKEKNT